MYISRERRKIGFSCADCTRPSSSHREHGTRGLRCDLIGRPLSQMRGCRDLTLRPSDTQNDQIGTSHFREFQDFTHWGAIL